MKKIKKSLALILVFALMAMSLAACGNKDKEESNTGTNNGGTAENNNGGTGTSKPAATAAPVEVKVDELEPVTLTWFLHGSTVTDDAAVLAKANEYLKEKLNVTLKPIWGTWADFDENVILAINGNDNVDIYFTCSWSPNEYNAFSKKGAYARLDDPSNNLIEKYASELWNTLPEVLTDGATVNGNAGLGVYAIPGYKDIATQNCWDVNVTMLEKYGYSLSDIQNANYYEFGDILAKVKAGEEAEKGGTFYPLIVEGAVLERMVTNSIIVTGDAKPEVLSYYLNPDDVSAVSEHGYTVFNKYATPEYEKFVNKSREYYLAGYIDPAMAISGQANSVRVEKLDAGEYLIATQSYALGYETQVSASRGIHVEMVPCTEAYVDTTSSQGAMMAVSSISKNKERAVMFLNLLNTDPYLMTLLNYGIEGVHYEKLDSGEISFITEARGAYSPWTNGMGNVTILPPQEGQGADFQEVFKAYYAAASKTPVLGWAVNPENIQNELAALANTASEYALALAVGAVDPATELPKFLKKLDDNGIQKVVDEANRQLTEYMALK